MEKWLRRMIPETFKNRILAAILLFVLAPFAVLVVYNFQEIERVMQDNAAAKSMEQLEEIEASFVDMLGLIMKTGLLLEQDSTIIEIMRSPDQYNPIERKKLVENKFASIENSFFLTGATVYYTLMDFHGSVYTSFAPPEPLRYDEMAKEPWVQKISSDIESERYIWNASDANYVNPGSQRRTMLSLYQIMRDDSLREYAYGRFSIDYEQWFNRMTQEKQSGGSYFLMDGDGKPIVQSDAASSVDPEIIEAILAVSDFSASASLTSERDKALYTYSKIPQLNGGFILNKMPLALLFEEVDALKRRFFFVFGLITLVLVLMTYFISSTITVPLKRLQRKMESSVKANLKVKLPEDGRGEILALTRSFNTMIHDINALLERLQLEERQRQVVRFQVLLSQMNPHFLLNTLNTIKSKALDHDEDEIYEICVSLGKILETTLNTEVDLILLKDEIALIDSYMHIQRTRFGGKIAVHYQISDELKYALIPKFCLQPLVENAIIHGFGQTLADGRIEIRAEARNSQLCLEVSDNGVGMKKAGERKTMRNRPGIGLQNIRESLELLFKNQSTGLAVESSDNGTRVRMHFPLLLSKPFRKEGESDVADDHRG